MSKEEIGRSDQIENGSDAPGFFRKFKERMKHGSFTCPFCREKFRGISELGSHLKQHCT